MKRLVLSAVVVLVLGSSGAVVAQQQGRVQVQGFTKSLWQKHGVTGQLRALTGAGTAQGFLGWRTIGGPTAWAHDLVRGSGSYLQRKTVFRQQLRSQQQLLDQMAQAQARTMHNRQFGVETGQGLRTEHDRRTGQFRYEPPHPGSQASWQPPMFWVMRTRGQPLVRSPGDGALAHPSPR